VCRLPEFFWKFLEEAGWVSLASTQGLIVLIVVMALFANVITNVPAVILLAHRVAQLAVDELQPGSAITERSRPVDQAWLMAAFVVGVAGSLTVQGSITQVIAYDIGKSAPGGSVSFLGHLRVGVPTTILTIALGLPLLLTQ